MLTVKQLHILHWFLRSSVLIRVDMRSVGTLTDDQFIIVIHTNDIIRMLINNSITNWIDFAIVQIMIRLIVIVTIQIALFDGIQWHQMGRIFVHTKGVTGRMIGGNAIGATATCTAGETTILLTLLMTFLIVAALEQIQGFVQNETQTQNYKCFHYRILMFIAFM